MPPSSATVHALKTISGNPKCRFLAEKAPAPSLGAEYLFSVLRANGYPTTVTFDTHNSSPWAPPHMAKTNLDATVSQFDESNCDVLFVSVNTDYFTRALSIIQAIKKKHPGIITCLGGPHATYAHKHTIANECIDFLCRGEGEIAILEFLDLIQNKRTSLPQGIYRIGKHGIEGDGFGTLVADLDALPYPDKSDYYAAIPQLRGTYTIITGRGCYMKCTFCNSNTVRNYYRDEGTNFMRRRSVDDVIQELHLAVERYKPGNIHFCDDTFIYNKKYMAEFAEKYAAEIGLPYFCSSTPHFFDLDIMSKLTKGGLTYLQVGIQTLNPDTRQRIFGRPETNENFAKYVAMLKNLGVHVQLDHIVNPWDSIDSFKQQIDLYSRIRPDWISAFYLMYYPDTQVIDSALRGGFVTEAEVEDMYNGKLKDNYFRGSSMEQKDISKIKELAVLLLLVPWIPRVIIRLLLHKNLFKILKPIPKTISFPLRFLNALLNKSDIIGRMHVKSLLRKFLWTKSNVSQQQLDEIKGIARFKNITTIAEGAVPKLRPRRAG